MSYSVKIGAIFSRREYSYLMEGLPIFVEGIPIFRGGNTRFFVKGLPFSRGRKGGVMPQSFNFVKINQFYAC